ncbi:NAD(P)-dependent oxidoreductase [Conexibacter sp. CPCC 206217]|uniref:NAD(P)-dependent oxidoreductase n=1 Tax=Conexibacter sp. CPCC 206217 TaxID=3064574 RepID=UPI00271E827C|nr:NAD(P)-dependent oxidoreductase [Conexibacter sp. CPCC 206217]MDO8209598.1 NAD(P)-dependent oxidoreductase [Conexibacter sp. CPCC 206217]
MSARDVPRVTVLGTGLLGSPVAVNLRRRGCEVTVWNRTHAKAVELERHGLRARERLTDAVAGADAVVSLLADGPVTERVLLDGGALAAMRPGALLVQMGTIGIASTERLAAAVAASAVSLVDAPVSGSRVPAERGELIVLAGADEAVRALAEPLLRKIGRRIHWAGDVGAGMRLKLVVQTWLLTLLEALAETVALAETAGLDPTRFLEAIEDGPLDLPYAQSKGAAMRDRAFDPFFPLALVPKDAGLARELAAGETELVAPMLDLVIARARSAIEEGHGAEDMAAIFRASRRP